MDRKEHLQWCKDRAMVYVEAGDLPQAFTSFNSDMRKHLETQNHTGLDMGSGLFFGNFLDTARDMEHWILGFN